jgi:hypothetical protein
MVEPVDIGSQRELFVDSYLIETMQGARLKLHEPNSAGVALRYDRPWEDGAAFYTTVFEDGGRYRMYYRCGWPGAPTCYAESADGVEWSKPELGLIEIDGSKRNNAIRPGRPAFSFCAFKDSRPGIPETERYKGNARDVSRPKGGLFCYVSANGIHWNQVGDEPVVPYSLENHFDSQNVMFWSEVEQQYLLYCRHMEGGRRATARYTSDDFQNWSEPTLMTYSDTGTTTPSAHLYTNQTHPYFRAPHIYVSMPARIFFADTQHISRDDDVAVAERRVVTDDLRRFYEANIDSKAIIGLGDFSDSVLMVTRAGTTEYDVTFRESFVRPGIGLSNWTTRSNYPALGVIQTGPNEMSMYVHRNYNQQTAYLERMTLRLDGFTSLNVPYSGGEMVTKPLTFDGGRLEINYSTSAAGSIRVELQDAGGVPISGYTLDDCVEVIGDDIEYTVAWPGKIDGAAEGGPDLRPLVGVPIRLRFWMQDADVFSFRFASDKA